MHLLEMFSSEKAGYETEKDDGSALSLKDMRKTKLTLSQINRLRQMKDIRELEQAKKVETLSAQYGTAGSAPGPGELG
ncbi:hypothetical protein UFOVP116_421 [uncultured Caudovirales phage]|uniref:Uncharacterized protein n=1 Tax=uncultured Caudovirales phage TaxID=2100421 RepID=A0A6J5L7H1_9CAUD|nr:hypothetical protein UFOVP116_421 [uncultured Caudovirales phage]